MTSSVPNSDQRPDHPELYLIRHGATKWSEGGRHTGATNIPLLDRGRVQATTIGQRLGGQTFALVLVSPLSRARVTCDLAGFGDQSQVTDDLREWDYGELEGFTTAEIRETHPGWTIWDGPVPGGETPDQVAARTDRVISRARSAEGDVALFAHGHVLRVLAARWCELDARDGKHFPLETGTLSILGREHEYPTIRVWNMIA